MKFTTLPILSLSLLALTTTALPLSRRSPQDNAAAFNDMLEQYNELQAQTMEENMEMQKAQAFWNPLESLSKSDATQRRSAAPQDDVTAQLEAAELAAQNAVEQHNAAEELAQELNAAVLAASEAAGDKIGKRL